MFLRGNSIHVAARCVDGIVSLRAGHACHLRRFCTGSWASSEGNGFRETPTADDTRSGTSKRNRRKRIDAPLKPPVQRFQPFGRPGGEGRAVAGAVIGGLGGHGSHGRRDSTSPNSGDNVRWLQENVVLNQYTAEGMLEREKRIGCLSMDELNQRLRWFRDRVGLSEDTTRKILVKRPSLLCKGVEDTLEPLAQWLLDEFDLEDEGLPTMLTSVPNILQCSIEGMTTKINWLAQRVGFSHAEAVQVVKACPFVLTNGIDSALAPRLQWIVENLALSEGDELRTWILANPRMVGHGIWSTLAPTMQFLEETVGLDREKARKFLVRNSLYFNSTSWLHHDYAAKQIWFRTNLGIHSGEEISKLLRREPRLLNRTSSRLSSLLEFLVEELGATKEEVNAAVMRDPWLLLTGIQTFWVPRVAALRNAGAEVSFKTQRMTLLTSRKDFDAHVEALSATTAFR